MLPARRWTGEIRFLVLDCPGALRRDRISARPRWRARDLDEQVEFGHWLRRNIPDRVDTSRGTADDTAAVVAAWVARFPGDGFPRGRLPAGRRRLGGALTAEPAA